MESAHFDMAPGQDLTVRNPHKRRDLSEKMS